ncbi:MAG: hypothetical protein ACRCUY_08315 [Thermoguttaceae bacterium]
MVTDIERRRRSDVFDVRVSTIIESRWDSGNANRILQSCINRQCGAAHLLSGCYDCYFVVDFRSICLLSMLQLDVDEFKNIVTQNPIRWKSKNGIGDMFD